MLRPERMSRVSVTGAKRVMTDVIETVHGLELLHITEYDGSFEGFDPGNPTEGADDASSKLVTVRALESTLGVEPEDAGPTRLVTDEALDEELDEIREEVNELDDRRDALRSDLRDVTEEVERMEFFVDLGIDLDLLTGYDSVSVAVGNGDSDAVREVLEAAEAFEAVDMFGEGKALAAYAYPADDEALEDILVGTDFAAVDVPEGEGAPESYLEELRHRRQQLSSRLSTVENEIEELKLDVAGFLLAAEEKLSIEVQKREAPLTFATTENAFVAEGWIPTEEFDRFEDALRDAVGEHVDVDELERADYDEDGHPTNREQVGDGDGPTADERSEQAVATDGGSLAFGNDSPPIVQDNPTFAQPFEAFVTAVGVPNYDELDPTVVLLLTFPAFFGLMIGDFGYGLLYFAIGAVIYRRYEPGGLRSMGGIAIWAGVFTMLFGFLYGEVFGTHQITSLFWEGIVGLGGAPVHKGLQPAYSQYALFWLVVSLLVGFVHLTIGYAIGFVDDLTHGFREATFENGSWLAMMFGIWAAIFSKAAAGMKPGFIFELFASPGMTNPATGEAIAEGAVVLELGFNGLPTEAGLAGMAVFAIGFLMLAIADPVEIVEFLDVLVNVLSYARLAAVLLAKAGLAFVVNALVFGWYVTGTGEHEVWHFGITHMPKVGEMVHGHEVTAVEMGGLVHSGIAGLVGGLAILVIGHVVVLVLGVTSAGLQAVRLEYVEFFGKFYEGNGKPYHPFGHEREYTAEE